MTTNVLLSVTRSLAVGMRARASVGSAGSSMMARLLNHTESARRCVRGPSPPAITAAEVSVTETHLVGFAKLFAMYDVRIQNVRRSAMSLASRVLRTVLGHVHIEVNAKCLAPSRAIFCPAHAAARRDCYAIINARPCAARSVLKLNTASSAPMNL